MTREARRRSSFWGQRATTMSRFPVVFLQPAAHVCRLVLAGMVWATIALVGSVAGFPPSACRA